ncbi:MAG TPA: hypothetical protein VN429_01530 [Methanospirillum sp.]|uniref:DUF7714 family protein n=1 Tax=Methanospirillum sp. TaxID=45200 RepID=UPI002C96638F|nr:hypothetical protein [Methanospirillum sp.]HWQ63068.1 hypothetical protein [Methanospirillum sp.]
MIFPPHCKCVGYAGEKPVGDQVYFLSEYLLHEVPEGFEILSVEVGEGTSMMRPVKTVSLIASAGDVYQYPERVILHNRGDLIRRAAETGKRCIIFTGIDEHKTFICDPDLPALSTVHVYDVTPPRAHLAETIRALEATGLFGELEIQFEYHIRDIRETGADVFPCRAGGFSSTIDSDHLTGNEQVAGCMTARQVLSDCYGKDFPVIDICPANAAHEEPFIARCCRAERTGVQTINGKHGVVVHWGSSPKQIADAVYELMNERKST